MMTEQEHTRHPEKIEPRGLIQLAIQGSATIGVFYLMALSQPLFGMPQIDALIYFFMIAFVAIGGFLVIRIISHDIMRRRLGASETTITAAIAVMLIVAFLVGGHSIYTISQIIQGH